MNFRYKRLSEHFTRSVIPIEILSEKEAIRYEVLVDSGADCNIMPGEIGELPGLSVASGRARKVGGITGGGVSYYSHNVTIRIGGWEHEVEIGFMPEMPSFGYGVVGQRGFFDLFKVTFNQRQGENELKPYSASSSQGE